jgi:hypothetical protein
MFAIDMGMTLCDLTEFYTGGYDKAFPSNIPIYVSNCTAAQLRT